MNMPAMTWTAYLRALRREYGGWPVIDTVAHRLRIRGRLGRYICYKTDRSFGLSESEARQGEVRNG
jgi:hypothetical protein